MLDFPCVLIIVSCYQYFKNKIRNDSKKCLLLDNYISFFDKMSRSIKKLVISMLYYDKRD